MGTPVKEKANKREDRPELMSTGICAQGTSKYMGVQKGPQKWGFLGGTLGV